MGAAGVGYRRQRPVGGGGERSLNTGAAPLVSVIVTTHNSAKTLAACLQSVRAQALPGLELIVVDNASSDQTMAIARELADQVLDHGPERSAQRNRGASAAHGEFLLFVDSDMRLGPGVVEECVHVCGGRPAVIIPELSVGEGFWTACKALERSCYAGDDLVEAARFIRRTAFEAASGFDQDLTGPEDFDLSRRLGGGARLPRTAALIIHDEGRLRLRDSLAKKRYYGRSFGRYAKKHGGVAIRQANLVLRPAYFRHWRRLAAQPGLTTGMLALRTMETLAAAIGTVEGMLLESRRASSRR